MKRLVIIAAFIALLLLFTSCAKNKGDMEAIETQEVEHAPYSSLKYYGFDVRPEGEPSGFFKTKNQDLIDDVWFALKQEEWAKDDHGTIALVAIRLEFAPGKIMLIYPNNIGEYITDEYSYACYPAMEAPMEERTFYSMPEDVYKSVADLLHEYTKDAFNEGRYHYEVDAYVIEEKEDP